MGLESHLKFSRDVTVDIKVFVVGSTVSSVREELKLRCLRFYTKFLCNCGVSTGGKTHETLFFWSFLSHPSVKRSKAELPNVITFQYQRAGSS